MSRVDRVRSCAVGRRPIIRQPFSPPQIIADGVTLCTSREEVSAAFKKLFNQKNRVGLINEAVLVQEFLDGGNTFRNLLILINSTHLVYVVVGSLTRMYFYLFYFKGISNLYFKFQMPLNYGLHTLYPGRFPISQTST